MKKTAATLLILHLAINSLSGFIELDRGEIVLETQFGVSHDGNITGSSIGDSDTIFSVDPTFRYQLGPSRGSLSASAGVNFNRFEEFSGFDSEDFHTDFIFSAPVAAGSPLSGTVSFGYREDTSVDRFVNDRVASDTSSISLAGAYRVRPKVSVTGGISYNDRVSDLYSDIEDKFGKAGVIIHDLWQDVGLTIDYRLREQTSTGEFSGNRLDKDDSIFMGLTGQLLPEHMFNKLEAFASIAVQDVNATQGEMEFNGTIIGYNGRISWEARPTTNVDLSFSRDVNTTINDRIVKNADWTIGVNQQFNRTVTGGINAGWRQYEFLGAGNENDDRFLLAATLQFILGRNWSGQFSVSYEDSSSTRAISNFERTVIGLFSVFRF